MGSILARFLSALGFRTVYALLASPLGIMAVVSAAHRLRTFEFPIELPFGLDFLQWNQRLQVELAAPLLDLGTWADLVCCIAFLLALGGAAFAGHDLGRGGSPPASTALIAIAVMQQAVPGGWCRLGVPLAIGLVVGALCRWRLSGVPVWKDLMAALVDLAVTCVAILLIPLALALDLVVGRGTN